MKKHALTVALVIWPIAVVACYAIARDWLHAEQGIANSAELQKLLGARRYQILIPREMDGYWLTLTPTIDGVAKPSSSGSVRGGSQITLIVQNDLANDLRYAWVGGGITMMGTCTNPFTNSGPLIHRRSTTVSAGDWLIRGGDNSVSMNGSAKYELRVDLVPPNSNG